MGFWLLHIVKYSFGMSIRDKATEVGGSIVADSGSKNDSLGILIIKELEHIIQGEGTADVGIEHEEAFRLAFQNSISEVVQTSSGAQCLIFS